MIPVIDISRWQGASVNMPLMASHNVRGLIARAGNGVVRDVTCAQNVNNARAAGMDTGVYWFCNPKVSDGRLQGKLLADAHLQFRCNLPPMLDVENYENEPGPASAAIYGPRFAAWLQAMCDTVETLCGRAPIIYTNAAYWDPRVGATTFGRYDNIIARYPFYNPVAAMLNVPPVDASQWGAWILGRTKSRPLFPRGWDTWDGWQFSAGYNGRGPTYGCSSTDLDLNIIKPDVYARWVRTSTPAPTPAPATPAASTSGEIMYIVGNADNKADPTRYAWNGLVKRHVRDEQEYGVLAYLKLVDPNTTLANPLWMTAERLATYPTI